MTDQAYHIGDRVIANFDETGDWFNGTISAIHKGDYGVRFSVDYDDGDKEAGIKPANIRPPLPPQPPSIRNESFRRAHFTSAAADAAEDEFQDLPETDIKVFDNTKFKRFRKGEWVVANFNESKPKLYIKSRIIKNNGDGTYWVASDDSSAPYSRRRMPYNKIKKLTVRRRARDLARRARRSLPTRAPRPTFFANVFSGSGRTRRRSRKKRRRRRRRTRRRAKTRKKHKRRRKRNTR